jgi:hypothetical protein
MNSSNERSWLLPAVVLVAGILLIAAGLITSTLNGGDLPTPTSEINPAEELSRVSLQDAFSAFQNSSAVLVDVRSSGSFATANIPGSLSIPLSEIGVRSTELNPEDWIITICA